MWVSDQDDESGCATIGSVLWAWMHRCMERTAVLSPKLLRETLAAKSRRIDAQRIGKITSELFIKPFIDVKVFYDPHDSSKHIIQVSTTVVGLQLDSHPNSPVRSRGF